MGKTFVKSRFGIYLCFISIALALFAGCEIGLGPAIDTDAPIVSIVSPETNDTIKKSFKIAGSSSDASGVESVEIVRLYNNDIKDLIWTNLGSVKPKKSDVAGKEEWSIDIEYDESLGEYVCVTDRRTILEVDRNGEKVSLCDGTYVVDVRCYDPYGRQSTIDSRAFDIDNTAPFFLVSSPAISGVDKTVYGRAVTVKGVIADNHDIVSMNVKAYNEDGSEIQLVKDSFSSFDKATTAVTIAAYSSDYAAGNPCNDEIVALHQNYMALFGDKDKQGFNESELKTEKNIGISITLEDSVGNESDYVYYGSSLLSAVKKESGNPEATFDASDGMMILDGTYNRNEFGKTEINGIRNLLLGKGDDKDKYISYDNDDGKNLLWLNVCPDNAAKYTIEGQNLESPVTQSSWKGITGTSEISVKIKAGRDGSPIDPKTVSVKIEQANVDGSKKAGGESFVSEKNSNPECFVSGDGDDATPVSELISIAPSRDGTSYTFRLKKTSVNYVTGSYYKISLSGKDVYGGEIVGEGEYGFTIISSGLSSTAKCADDRKTIRADQVSELKIQIDDPEKQSNTQPKALLYEVKYFDGYYASESAVKDQFTWKPATGMTGIPGSSLTPNTSSSTYEATIPLVLPDSMKKKNSTIIVNVIPTNGIKSEGGNPVKFILHVDGVVPSLEIENSSELSTKAINTTTSPYFRKSGDGYTYELRGKVSDVDGSGVQSIEYKYGSAWIPIDSTPVTKAEASWMQKINVSLGSNQSISLRAKDVAGNITSENTFNGLVFGEGVPAIEPPSVEPYYKDSTNLIFGISDSAEIASPVTVNATLNGVSKSLEPNLSLSPDKKSGTVSVTIPKEDGEWNVMVSAKNISGGQSEICTVTTEIDSTKPAIEKLDVRGGRKEFYTSTTLIYDLECTDANPLKSVRYWVTSASGSGEPVTLDVTDKKFSITPTNFATKEECTLNVVVIDVAGNESDVKTDKVRIDQESPALKVLFWDDQNKDVLSKNIPSKVYFGSKKPVSMTLYGLVSDGGGLSSLDFAVGGTAVTPDSVYYTTKSLDETNLSSDFTSASWIGLAEGNCTAVKAWKAKFSATSITDGGVLSFSAKDRADLTTFGGSILTFVKDDEAPAIRVTNLKSGDLITENNLVSDSLTVLGKWSDIGSGNALLEWKIGESGSYVTENVESSYGNAEVTWSISIPRSKLTPSLNTKLYLKATDCVGNTTPIEVDNLKVDYSIPTVESNISPLAQYYNNSSSDLAVVFTGKDADNLGKSTIVLDSLTCNGASVSDDELFETDDANSKATLKLSRSGTRDGEWIVKVHSIDSVGRKSDTLTLSTIIDGTAPSVPTSLTLEEKAYSADSWFKNNIIRVGGVSTDNGTGLAGIYYKKSNSKPADVLDGEMVGAVSGKPFSFAVSNLDLGENRIWIQALDVVGNKSDVVDLSINVDNTLPSVGHKYYSYDNTNFESSASGKVRTNGSHKLYVYGNISDMHSGIESMSLKIGSNPVSAAITYSTGEITTESSIAGLSFEELSDSNRKTVKSYRIELETVQIVQGDLFAQVFDRAGNTVQQKFFTIELDKLAPTVELISPVTKEFGKTGDILDVNGRISVSGRSSDDELSYVAMSYSLDGGNTWSDYTYERDSSAYSWSFDLDMTKNTSGTITFLGGSSYNGVSKPVFVRISAVDTAGNKAEKIFEYSANPDGDRPVIVLNNVNFKVSDTQNMDKSNPVWVREGKIYGTVIDDDGISKFEYSVGDNRGYNELILNNGAWSVPLTSEGSNTVYFRITDKANSVFESKLEGAGVNQYSSPKLRDNNGTSLDDISVMNLKVDTKAPTLEDIFYESYDSRVPGYGTRSKDFANGKFGGDYKKFRLSFNASDGNGIASATVVFEGRDKKYNATDNGTGTFVSDDIIVEGINSGTYRAVVEVTDAAGTKTQKTVSVFVDNEAPAINIIVPSSSVKSSTTVYGTVSELGGHVYFAVTKNGASRPADSAMVTGLENAVGKWQEITDASLGWTVYFDNVMGSGTHTSFIKDYLFEIDPTIKTRIDSGTYFGEETVDFHIMAIDALGNKDYGVKSFLVDPLGDNPVVTITYPKNDSILGGSVMIMGSATDNEEARYVGLYIDTNGDGVWNWSDIEKIKADIDEVKFGKLNVAGKTFTEETPVSGQDKNYYKNYAVMVPVNGGSWNLTLNNKGTFDPTGSGKSLLKVWAFAVDNKGNSSTNEYDSTIIDMPNVSFYFDKDSPKIENQQLVKGSNILTYKEGLDVKGEWFYEAFVYDDTGINTIKVDGVTIVSNETPVVPPVSGITATAKNDGDKHGFTIKIRVGTNENGVVRTDNHNIEFTEKKDLNPLSGTAKVSVNIDNKAPEILARGNGERPADGYNIKHYELDGKVVNMNGFYTFGSKATENPVTQNGVTTNQTGIERVAFYITRDIIDGVDDEIHTLYDVMLTNGHIHGYESQAASGNLVESDGIYWIPVAIESSTPGAITISNVGANVHKGGMVKIGDVFYRIKNITGKTLSLETSLGEDSTVKVTETRALIALASIVDNPTQEGEGGSKNADGYWSNPALDDGDLMVESLVKQGTSWIWEANINTKNVGDGKAVLHYVVFDRAGNCSERADVPIFIGNNLPRIAGLVFATDDNADGAYAGSEIYSYSNYYKNEIAAGKDIVSATFPTDSTTEKPKAIALVRNSMKISPEVVGGNGKLYAVSKLYKRSATDWNATPYVTMAKKYLNVSGTADSNAVIKNIESQSIGIEYTVEDMVRNQFEDGDLQRLSVNISDSTPGLSMSADVNVIFNLKLKDEVVPDIRIKPFYWNSSSDNSLYKHSRKNGHIEVSSDVDVSTYVAGNAVAGICDKDPKVSGKVVIEGVAVDNKLLRKLDVKLNGIKYTLGTYDGVWTVTEERKFVSGDIPSGGFAAEIGQATYQDMIDCGFITLGDVPNGFTAENVVPEFTQEFGHVAKWTGYMDSAVIAKAVTGNEAYADFKVTAIATDRGNPYIDNNDQLSYGGQYNDPKDSDGQSGGDDGKGAKTDFYRIDVVPYITDVSTQLTRNHVAIPRTALGNYPVMEGDEDIVISGFNLETAKLSLKVSNDIVGGEAFKVAGIEPINNMNNNDAVGNYSSKLDTYRQINTYAYNRLPNNVYSNILTDDVYFDVWSINSNAGMPHEDGYIEQLVMKINPKDDMLGYSFVNATFNSAMAKTDKSYIKAKFYTGDFNTSSSLVYDVFGNPYGTAAGGDETWNSCYLLDNNNDRTKYKAFESTGQDGLTDRQRIVSPSLATTSTANATTIYLTYFDAANGRVCFRRFDAGKDGKVTDGMTDKTGDGGTASQNAANVQVLAGDSAVENGNYNASEYFSLAAIKGKGISLTSGGNDDMLVFVWYDSLNRALYYMYHTNPSGIVKGTTRTSTTSNGIAWSTPVKVLDDSGAYCKVAIDVDGGVHIASYNVNSTDLEYAYIAPSEVKKTAPEIAKCSVDAYGPVGMNLTLDVAKSEKGNNIPYIGYYTTSGFCKCAYINEDKLIENGSYMSGVDSKDDMFNGNWEVATVPTTSKLQMVSKQTANINIGVWKNSNGVIKNSPSTASTVSKDEGVVYGNGTKNPVLAYIVSPSSAFDRIETAQLKYSKMPLKKK